MIRFLVALTLVLTTAINGYTGTPVTALGITAEEIAVWNDRRVNGPYKSNGDAGTNTPGDWDRINSNANTFRAGSASAYTWAGHTGPDCWTNVASSPHWVGDPTLPSRTDWEVIRDTAFRYLLMGNTADRDHVVDAFLDQVAQAGTDFTDTDNWLTHDDCASGDGYSWEIAMWLNRMLQAYDYIRHDIDSGDRTTIDNWFIDSLDFWLFNFSNAGGGWARVFPNRDNDDYTTVGGNAEHCTGNQAWHRTHFSGDNTCVFHLFWSNRSGNMHRVIGMGGLMFNRQDFKDAASRWFKEFIRFNTFPDNLSAEMDRFEEDAENPSNNTPTLGFSYVTQSIGTMADLAMYFARAGDTSLLDYTTSLGHENGANVLTPHGGTKSLLNLMIEMGKLVDGSRIIYGTTNATFNGDPDYVVGPIDQLRAPTVGSHSIGDNYFFHPNLYYQNAYIASIAERTAPGAPDHPPYGEAASGGFDQYGGAWGTFPGISFMFGQMEDNAANPFLGGSSSGSGELRLQVIRSLQ